MNIKGSPFVFSDCMNTFVSFGCNNWATVAETDHMVVGCKSHCNTSFIYQEQQRHKCSGFNCYQTTIPSRLQIFTVDFRNKDDNTSVGSGEFAFLVEKEQLLDLEDINSSSMEKMQFHFVPMVLEWRIYNQTNNSSEMLESFNNRKDFYCEIYPDNNRLSNTISKNEP